MDHPVNGGSWAPGSTEVLNRLWHAGATIRQIRAEFPERSRQQIHNKIRRLGLGRRSRWDRLQSLARAIAAGQLGFPADCGRWPEDEWLELVGMVQEIGQVEAEDVAFAAPIKLPRAAAPRPGQSDFRRAVLSNYGWRCCVTGDAEAAALDAAHVIPFASGGGHQLSNGLALRSDLHRLFDAGLITVDPLRLTVKVSSRAQCASTRGLNRLPMNRQAARVPPSREALAWHSSNIFKN